jgi:hypothetical protein
MAADAPTMISKVSAESPTTTCSTTIVAICRPKVSGQPRARRPRAAARLWWTWQAATTSDSKPHHDQLGSNPVVHCTTTKPSRLTCRATNTAMACRSGGERRRPP